MDSEMCLGADISDTVVGLAEVRSLVHRFDVADHQALALVAHTGTSHGNVAVVLAPQDVRLRIPTDHAVKVDRLAGEDGLVLRLLADKRFHCKYRDTRGQKWNINTQCIQSICQLKID